MGVVFLLEVDLSWVKYGQHILMVFLGCWGFFFNVFKVLLVIYVLKFFFSSFQNDFCVFFKVFKRFLGFD